MTGEGGVYDLGVLSCKSFTLSLADISCVVESASVVGFESLRSAKYARPPIIDAARTPPPAKTRDFDLARFATVGADLRGWRLVGAFLATLLSASVFATGEGTFITKACAHLVH